MKKSKKRLELKKLTISKLSNANSIKGGGDTDTCGETDATVFPRITCFLCPIINSSIC